MKLNNYRRVQSLAAFKYNFQPQTTAGDLLYNQNANLVQSTQNQFVQPPQQVFTVLPPPKIESAPPQNTQTTTNLPVGGDLGLSQADKDALAKAKADAAKSDYDREMEAFAARLAKTGTVNQGGAGGLGIENYAKAVEKQIKEEENRKAENWIQPAIVPTELTNILKDPPNSQFGSSLFVWGGVGAAVLVVGGILLAMSNKKSANP